MSDVFIYGLLDPNTGKCRYVGKANNVEERYYHHLKESKKKNLYKHNWIQQLLRQDKKPELKILEVCNELNWVEKEIWWINYFKKKKQTLTNLTKGGDGVFLFKKGPVSEETKRKISKTLMGHSVSEETRRKMSIRRNKWLETNPPIQLGRKQSKESRKKMSEALTGRKLSPEHRNKVIGNLKRDHIRFDITLQKILEQTKIYNFSQFKICEYFKCARHTLTQKVKKHGYKNWLDFKNKLSSGDKLLKVDKKSPPKNLLFEEILRQVIKYDFKLTKISLHFDCDRHFIVKTVRKNGYKDWRDFRDKVRGKKKYTCF